MSPPGWLAARCDLCGGPGEELHPADPARGLLRHARCPGCGLVFVDPRPADLAGANEALYGGSAAGAARERGARHAALLRPLLARSGGRAPRVLDVGCGQGAFLGAARALGCEVVGVELSAARAAEAGERTGVPVHTGELATLPPGPGFDLIRLHQVLEHVPSPRELLGGARARLAPGGEVVLATPNAASLAHRVLGGEWRQLGHARNGHLVLVDPASLARLAMACGLRPRAVRTRGARAWSLARQGLARRAWRLLEAGLEPWVRWRGQGGILEARLRAVD